jgi:uncharacterized protein (TIGR02271 family)
MLLESNTYQVTGNTVTLIGGESIYQTQRISGNETAGMTTSVDQLSSGSTSAAVSVQELAANESIVVPVIREEVHVGTRVIERGGVRVHKRVEEREEVVEQPVFHEEVSVERIAIGRPIDEVVSSRQEGDTLIIPVLEEMLVVERRLVLKEEVRITKRRTQETERASVILREERVDIEQLSSSTPIEPNPATTTSQLGGSEPMA